MGIESAMLLTVVMLLFGIIVLSAVRVKRAEKSSDYSEDELEAIKDNAKNEVINAILPVAVILMLILGLV